MAEPAARGELSAILQLVRKTEFDYWIGESTFEVWTDYAYRLCGLGPYLHKHQMLEAG